MGWGTAKFLSALKSIRVETKALCLSMQNIDILYGPLKPVQAELCPVASTVIHLPHTHDTAVALSHNALGQPRAVQQQPKPYARHVSTQAYTVCSRPWYSARDSWVAGEHTTQAGRAGVPSRQP